MLKLFGMAEGKIINGKRYQRSGGRYLESDGEMCSSNNEKYGVSVRKERGRKEGRRIVAEERGDNIIVSSQYEKLSALCGRHIEMCSKRK
jgi:hypothetical protein